MYTKLTSNHTNSSLHSQNKNPSIASTNSSKHIHTYTHPTPHILHKLSSVIFPSTYKSPYTSPLFLPHNNSSHQQHQLPKSTYTTHSKYILQNSQPTTTLNQNQLHNVHSRRNMVVLRMRRKERAAQGHRHHYLCEARVLSRKCYRKLGGDVETNE
jgi:hypothetical protein